MNNSAQSSLVSFCPQVVGIGRFSKWWNQPTFNTPARPTTHNKMTQPFYEELRPPTELDFWNTQLGPMNTQPPLGTRPWRVMEEFVLLIRIRRCQKPVNSALENRWQIRPGLASFRSANGWVSTKKIMVFQPLLSTIVRPFSCPLRPLHRILASVRPHDPQWILAALPQKFVITQKIRPLSKWVTLYNWNLSLKLQQK